PLGERSTFRSRLERLPVAVAPQVPLCAAEGRRDWHRFRLPFRGCAALAVRRRPDGPAPVRQHVPRAHYSGATPAAVVPQVPVNVAEGRRDWRRLRLPFRGCAVLAVQQRSGVPAPVLRPVPRARHSAATPAAAALRVPLNAAEAPRDYRCSWLPVRVCAVLAVRRRSDGPAPVRRHVPRAHYSDATPAAAALRVH